MVLRLQSNCAHHLPSVPEAQRGLDPCKEPCSSSKACTVSESQLADNSKVTTPHQAQQSFHSIFTAASGEVLTESSADQARSPLIKASRPPQ